MPFERGEAFMGPLGHWHPVLDAARLRQKPVGVVLDGREIVLFRDGQGRIGALDDCCPHRRMRLSLGCVVDGRLQCTYHGWTYDRHGAGESPGTPKLHATASHFDTAERYGAIWIKAPGGEAALPEFQVEGYEFVGRLQHEIDAPLELVLDNFTEVEHTPTTHANFGYDLARMSEVQTHVESTDTSVRVVNTGPQKRTPWIVQKLAGLHSGDQFTDDWTTYFSPVYTVYDQFWCDPQTGVERRDRWRIYVFFNPLSSTRTQLMTFAYLRAASWARSAFIRLTRPALVALVNLEIECDVKMLEQLADKNPQLVGMKLSRFDRVLGMNRQRIERIYRGHLDATTHENGASAVLTPDASSA